MVRECIPRGLLSAILRRSPPLSFNPVVESALPPANRAQPSLVPPSGGSRLESLLNQGSEGYPNPGAASRRRQSSSRNRRRTGRSKNTRCGRRSRQLPSIDGDENTRCGRTLGKLSTIERRPSNHPRQPIIAAPACGATEGLSDRDNRSKRKSPVRAHPPASTGESGTVN